MSGTTRLAIIIPAATCPSAQIDAILPQLTKRDRLIVVLNAAGAHRWSCVARDAPPRLTFLRYPQSIGAAAARNAGAALVSDAAAFVFADSDDKVEERWLPSLARPVLAQSSDLAAGGLIIAHRDRRRVLLPSIDYWFAQSVFGGNVALSASAWRSLGGFDESLRCCEDTDLAWRAISAGLRISITTNALVCVKVRTALEEFRQHFAWGSWSVTLLKRHGLATQRLPTLPDLLAHKTSAGLCSSPLQASFGQWLGQLSGKLLHRPIQ